jgi:serine/threonine protein kinase
VGLIHRDIKPANLLVDQQGVVKIVDLGLARLEEEPVAVVAADADEQQILGTADFLAPEQSFDSFNVTPVADIYSLGCSLYYLLTGRPPFPTGNVSDRVLAHRQREPENLFDLRPDTPPALVAICQKMMAKRAEDRYQTADELMNVLQDWLDGKASRVLAMQARRSSKRQAKPKMAPHHAVDDELLTLAPLSDDTPPQPAAPPGDKQTTEPSVNVSASSKADESSPSAASAAQTQVCDALPFDPELEAIMREQRAAAENPQASPLGQSTLYSAGASHQNNRVPMWLIAVAGLALLGAVAILIWIVARLTSG